MTNIKIVLSLAATLISLNMMAVDRPEWNNVKVLQENREAPHTSMMVYASEENAVSFRRNNRIISRF